MTEELPKAPKDFDPKFDAKEILEYKGFSFDAELEPPRTVRTTAGTCRRNHQGKLGKMNEERKEQFTPGPWVFNDYTGSISPLTGGEPVCHMWTFDCHEVYGNGRLIAAAPEMYEALSDVQDVLRGICQSCDTPDSIRIKLEPLIYRGEAIQKKARGEE